MGWCLMKNNLYTLPLQRAKNLEHKWTSLKATAT